MPISENIPILWLQKVLDVSSYYHLLCDLCQLRWYRASMPIERTLQCWHSLNIALRLSSEAGAHVQLVRRCQ